jgi:purine-cytosine permease-like protein
MRKSRFAKASIAAEIAAEAPELADEIKHDYSTSAHGIVPLSRRHPLWHFASLWLTFSSGFSYLFLGFEIHDGGNSLSSTVGIVLLASGIYLAYVMFAAYLGSRTGQTHTLLTRSVFGVVGSGLISLLIFLGAVGWAGFQANLLAQIWDGLYGWGSVELLGILLAVVMVTNNIFGFSGISVFARYVATPILILWALYLVIKGLVTDYSSLTGTPKPTAGGLTLWPAVGVVMGYLAYGNEPDLWRYGKPRFWWPAPAFVFTFIIGLLVSVVGGWEMAELAHTSDFSGLIHFTTNYSFFGVFWLAWILATVTQVAINDSNYYEAVNAVQNIMGGWHGWRRIYTCALAAAGAGLAAWLVVYVITNGFLKMATFLSITAVSATVIMVIDHFLLPRLFGVSRSLLVVPSWSETAWINWPGVIALVLAVGWGGYASGLWPGESATTYLWLPPVEAWAIAGIGYIALVAAMRALTPGFVERQARLLGFSRPAREADVAPGEIADIATRGEEPVAEEAPQKPAERPEVAPL